MILIKYFIIGLTTIITYLVKGLATVLLFFPKYLIIGLKYITEKKDPNNPDQEILKDKFVTITTITLSLITYLLCIFIITRWYVQTERTKKFTNTLGDDILAVENNTNNTDIYQDQITTPTTNSNNTTDTEVTTNFINVNLDYYIKKNKETVAWLQVNNTNINYPVVKHNDNSYYLTHDFYQRKSNNGWVFADYRNNFETLNSNTIIYAHNLIDRTMFGQIPYLLRKNWFNNPNSHYIKLSTKNTNSIWQIFSVYKIAPTTDYLQHQFNSMENYQQFLNLIKERSTYKFNIDVTNKDKIITLSTCDDIGTKRVVVHAKLVRIEDNK